ncbi:hypothetical protein [Streptomyces daghestanicus]|uniref:Uncharacterized protein n=1 Tax=Streptomyces daghestanicus TaxID=66885 RepID=A0ABQ3Q898_9ACTN|nr:hypothetical protein [Streptomyces daghestanicus]GGU71024.1 hypothetical protein GCM10010259_70420 [Streptomyces daghestanicus]GHI33241.1 hypothetical protein Sdagh_49710 [Streptomyces daghestanicus]GHI33488.1 hypothetical protein Sdagh_52180 [Streptomyces daghestanicus]
MGSLFEAIEAEEAEVRGRVEQLKAQLAELTERLEAEQERLSRLVITRETAGELLARMSDGSAADETPPTAAAADVSPFAGAERQVVGVLSVPKWQPGMAATVLPRVYQDILEVVDDAPGPVRAKQIVPRIGLPVENGKIEVTRSKLKRLVVRGWLDETTPGLFTPSATRKTHSSNTP